MQLVPISNALNDTIRISFSGAHGPLKLQSQLIYSTHACMDLDVHLHNSLSYCYVPKSQIHHGMGRYIAWLVNLP